MSLFGPDSEKIQRWKNEGKISRLRSAVEGGGPHAEAAQKALAEIVADPSRMSGVDDSAVAEAFRTLLDLDVHAACGALVSYGAQPTSRSAVACGMIDRLAERPSDAALLALVRLAGSRLGNVGDHAVEALGRIDHPQRAETLRAAIVLVGQESLGRMLELLETYRITGAGDALIKRFASAAGNLRKPLAKALHRQGFPSTRCADPQAAAYLMVEEGRYGDVAALGAVAWQPLAEALGSDPAPDARTQELLRALHTVDPGRLEQALRLKLLRAATAAVEKPSARTFQDVRDVAAWVLPAMTDIFGRGKEAEELADIIRSERFRLAKGILDIE